LGVPLLVQNRAVGMLTLDHDQAGHYTARHADLALTIANQAAIAIENARLFEQAQTLAVVMERQRLARELHDSVSQALYGIALGARTARTLLDRDPRAAAEPIDYVLSLANAGMAEMRALIFELRPESLEIEGLVAALSKLADSLRARHQLDVRAELGEEPDLGLEVKEALYRIAQEALHNIAKHARAGAAELRLAAPTPDSPAVTLDIRDDGAGFDPSGAFPGHLGLRSMRERAARLGGSLAIDSAPGRGAHLRVRIPISNKRET
jgi:signal transduction histidine kinase